MIRNIWAVGRNYADHAKELGNQVPSAAGNPMIFLKAGSSAVIGGGEFQLPRFSEDVHHECEITLRFGADLKFDALTVGIDLTARDVQEKAKSQGHPWTLAKSFKAAALIGEFKPLPQNLDSLPFSLKVNGEVRQAGNTSDMIHSIEKLRQYVVERFPVVPGDLLMTGTPKGVAALQPGDLLDAEIPGVVQMTWRSRA